MKKILSLIMAAVLILSSVLFAFASDGMYLNVSELVPPNTGKDVSADIQKIIDENPNRALAFADGEYLISKPILTPAAPEKSVSLHLSDFAIFKATGDWTKGEAVVQLGGKNPANNTSKPGSNYSFEGGIIDGSGVADGISINSGRETMIRNVSIKNTVCGIHILYGANSGSSDADISGINIIGTGTTESVGILVEGFDNTFTNIRIGNVFTGVHLKSAGNMLHNIHPLYYSDYTDYENSCGFLIESGTNWFDFCYSDQFGIGFRTTGNNENVMNDCFCFWYSDRGTVHTAFKADKKFRSVLTNFRADFPDRVENYYVSIGNLGGNGTIINPIVDTGRLSSHSYLMYDDDAFLVVKFFGFIAWLFEKIF